MKLDFFMAMKPPTVTAQEHKVSVKHGKPIFYDPPELSQAKQKLNAYLAKHRPAAPFDGPLELVTTWCFPGPDEMKLPVMWKSTKPDTDNLNKMLKDCMTYTGYWHDDALVCREIIEKFFVTETPGIRIRITPLDES